MKKIMLIPALLFTVCMILAAVPQEAEEELILTPSSYSEEVIEPQLLLPDEPQLTPHVLPESQKQEPLLPETASLPMSPSHKDFYETVFYAAMDNSPPNHELQDYIPSQTQISGNTMTFTAERQDDGYISGKAESIFGFRYGSLSLRIDTIDNPGLFPAVWLLPAQGGLLPELDIYELIGREPENFYGVLHFTDAVSGEREKSFFTYSFPDRENTPSSVVIEFEWTPDALIWKYDGDVIFTLTENVPQIPMYLIFNLAVGGIWCGPPTEDSVFPAVCRMEILEFYPDEIYTR